MRQVKLMVYSMLLTACMVNWGSAWAQTVEDKGKVDLTQSSRAFLTLGGDAIAGTLKTEIHDNSNMQIYRYVNNLWQKQIYGVASKASLLRINGTNYTCSGSYFQTGSTLALVSQTAITANHIQTIWQTAGVVRVTQDATYVTGTAYVRYKWTITNLSGNTQTDIRFFHGQDNTLNGNDYGMSAWDPATNSIIAYSTSGTSQFRLYFQGITVPFGYQGGSYSAMRSSVMAGALTNVATATSVDQGYALEWRTATLASNASYVIDAVEKFSSAAVTNLQVTAPLSGTVSSGSPSELTFQVRNLTASATTVTLNSTVNLSGWTAAVQGNTTITIAGNATQAVSVLVTAPGNASGTTAVVTLTAIDGSGTASDFCNVTATGPLTGIFVTETAQTQNTGLVTIGYSLYCPEGGTYDIGVEVSFNNGSTYTLIPAVHLTGDLTDIQPGAGHSIVWNAAANYPGVSGNQMKIRVFSTPQ